MPQSSAQTEYFLQVVKTGEYPHWPVPTEELTVKKQPLEDDFIQYFAYDKSSKLKEEEICPAESLAEQNKTSQPAVLINELADIKDDGRENFLELILIKGGHAWARTTSSMPNLEDNINSLIEYADTQFSMKVDHFVTPNKLSTEVENVLVELESANNEEEGVQEPEQHQMLIKTPHGDVQSQIPTSGVYTPKQSGGGRFSKVSFLLPIIVVLIVFILVIFLGRKMLNKDLSLSTIKSAPGKIVEMFKGATPTPTPTPLPTPTPTPTPPDHSGVKVRVLNGTHTTGAAKTLAEKLTTNSWEVIKTGNAPNQNTAQTTIKSKKDFEQFLAIISSLLAPDLEATIASSLNSSDAADLEIVIGKK